MPDKELTAISDYEGGSSTSTEPAPAGKPEEVTSAPSIKPEEVTFEPERYGTGKARRIKIRAKIIHDKD